MKKVRKNDREVFAERFQKALRAFVDEQARYAPVRTIDARKMIKLVSKTVLSGGKRMRPYLGVKTATSCGISSQKAMKLGIALELFHDFALVHDDVMDRSSQRRGAPTIHQAYQDEHKRKEWKGSAEHYGYSGAILAGDLLYTWAERAMDGLGLEARVSKRLLQEWNLMKEEVILGQTLDVTMSVLPHGIGRRQLMDVLALKSGRYSIGRPIILGYALADQRIDARTVLEATEPLGLAFQIQDDILSTFGNPKKTGKGTDSDLREGKITILAWETKRRIVDAKDQEIWDHAFGNENAKPAEIEALRKIMKESGACEYVQTLSKQLIQLSIEKAYALPRISDWFIALAESLDDRQE